VVNKILQIAAAENWTDSEKNQSIAQRSDFDSFAVAPCISYVFLLQVGKKEKDLLGKQDF